LLLFKKSKDVYRYLENLRKKGRSIGFVPTMGALHTGHISLLKRAKSENDVVCCSIFVNPTQFNDQNDFNKYPKPVEKDIEILYEVNCDLLFLPEVEEIYPNGLDHLKNFDLGDLENMLEGASRPGHFKGVTNVVDRFLEIVSPHRLYLGQKDFQQVKVIQKLLRITGRNVELVMCPILRGENGLALSSRNSRLTPQQRENASALSKTLFFIRDHYKEYTLKDLQFEATLRINRIPETSVDYLQFCNADSFQIINSWIEAHEIVAVAAININGVRLLDNILLPAN
jgi:pantoate--beta-alanine ligase